MNTLCRLTAVFKSYRRGVLEQYKRDLAIARLQQARVDLTREDPERHKQVEQATLKLAKVFRCVTSSPVGIMGAHFSVL